MTSTIEYADLDQVKIKVNIDITDDSSNTQLQVAIDSANNYVYNQILPHSTPPAAGVDPALETLASNLAAANYLSYQSPNNIQNDEKVSKWETRIQDYVMSNYGLKSANGLAGDQTFGVTAGYTSSSSGSGGNESGLLTEKGQLHGYSTQQGAVPAPLVNNYVLTADSSNAFGVSWQPVGAASQTPWVSDIDADQNSLNNADTIQANYSIYPEQGSSPGTIAESALVYSLDDGGVSKLYTKWSDGTEIEIGSGSVPDGTAINQIPEWNGSAYIPKTGDFEGITGLGTQTQTLMMGNQNINNVNTFTAASGIFTDIEISNALLLGEVQLMEDILTHALQITDLSEDIGSVELLSSKTTEILAATPNKMENTCVSTNNTWAGYNNTIEISSTANTAGGNEIMKYNFFVTGGSAITNFNLASFENNGVPFLVWNSGGDVNHQGNEINNVGRIRSDIYQSNTAPRADGGTFQLASVDDIQWRNNADNGNNVLEIDSSDHLQYNLNEVLDDSNTSIVINKTMNATNNTFTNFGFDEIVESLINGQTPLSAQPDPDDTFLIIHQMSGGFRSVTFSDLATGDVMGPASSTDNAIPRYDGTTGKIIQNSGITIDDSNVMTFPNTLAGGNPSIIPVNDASNKILRLDSRLEFENEGAGDNVLFSVNNANNAVLSLTGNLQMLGTAQINNAASIAFNNNSGENPSITSRNANQRTIKINGNLDVINPDDEPVMFSIQATHNPPEADDVIVEFDFFDYRINNITENQPTDYAHIVAEIANPDEVNYEGRLRFSAAIDGTMTDFIIFNEDLDQNNIQLKRPLEIFEYADIAEIPIPTNPDTGSRRLFVDENSAQLSILTAGGSVVSLEQGGGGIGIIPYTWSVTDEDSPITSGIQYVTEALNDTTTITAVVLSLKNAPTANSLEVDILQETGTNTNVFASIFSTLPTVDINEFTSQTASIPVVISNTMWAVERRLQIIVTTPDANFDASGLKITVVTQ